LELSGRLRAAASFLCAASTMPAQAKRVPRVPVDYDLRATVLTQRNIFLIGPMGSGKTAVGRHLARMLRFTFYDSDADIEARTGVDIAFIFEKEGEPGFRVREKESIERLTRLRSIVLATGGGAG